VKHEGWTVGELSPEIEERLDRFEELLRDRAVPAGLISGNDVPEIRERHILDSLRGVPLVPGPAQDVADLGTGAGLPGLPMAIALPHLRFTLVDSRRSRVAFLELAAERLGLLNVTVAGVRVEEVSPGFDVCLARGFAAPAATWSAAERLLREDGRLLYWAGASFDPGALPDGARLAGRGDPGLESGGPIVIMARQ
jgi:16S rRNA (guanine527-N7)-methyltransferase